MHMKLEMKSYNPSLRNSTCEFSTIVFLLPKVTKKGRRPSAIWRHLEAPFSRFQTGIIETLSLV